MFSLRLRAILSASLILVLLTVCDDLEGALNESTSETDTRDAVAVLWARPYWARVTWQLPGSSSCPAGTFSYTADRLYCGSCLATYTWVGAGDPDYCYRCEPGYTFALFDDGYFCYACPAGYSIEAYGDSYLCFAPG